MLFASPTFLFFFLPGCVAAYFLSPSMRVKNTVLVAASLIFYAWGEPALLPLILAMTAFNFVAARAIDERSGGARTAALTLAVTANLLVLGVFKYAGFAVQTFNALPGAPALPAVEIPLPLGISFFTFHCLSYLIDTWRRRFPASRRLSEVALYIFFFPQLIAGPIVRYKTIAQRLRMRRHSVGRASAGLRMFAIGLAQKLLLADPMAAAAEGVFDKTPAPNLLESWVGALAYTMQIYFDFAGYSTMAIGLGVVFGFSLPRNFRTPYASRSITAFWRRWHISLSAWFRDYLYIPLGGNRRGPVRTYVNLVIVFLLCGLWHGASWTFVLWGLWHGTLLVAERAGLGHVLARAPSPLAWTYTLLGVVLGWVLFRAHDLAAALQVWRGMVGLNGVGPPTAPLAIVLDPALLATLALGMVIAVFGLRWGLPWMRAARTPVATFADNILILGLLAVCVLRVAAGTYSPFLYFRF